MKSKIILPLDGVTLEEAIVIVGKTKDLVWGYKVNTLLLKEGFKIISILKDFGVKVMVDPKLYDIPHTMNTYIENLLNSRADIITVHASAMYSPASNQKSILAGVTILTSFNQESFEQVFSSDEILCQKVLQFAKFCQKKEYGYVVCSPRELVTLNSLYIKKICPGIRPKWYQQEDDQVRTMTPAESIRAGADLMVMGRPILHAKDMSEALKKTNSEIEEVLETKLRRGV